VTLGGSGVSGFGARGFLTAGAIPPKSMASRSFSRFPFFLSASSSI
jgi:hypothetical protein